MNHVNSNVKRKCKKRYVTPYIYRRKSLHSNYVIIDTIDTIVESEYDIISIESDKQVVKNFIDKKTTQGKERPKELKGKTDLYILDG